MDAVITYVDGLDPLWQSSYAKAVGRKPLEKRFRDWGTLKYLLRGIRRYMPFIKNVYLVVSGETQVPSWVNKKKLHVVLHEDIIPQQYLPVFNSTAIEMFLHRIPGLDEQYVYFNDDIFPLAPSSEEDFFIAGKSVNGFKKCWLAVGLFKKQTRNSDYLARKACGRVPHIPFVRPQHSCTAMLRSACEEMSEKASEQIAESISSLRKPKNLNQYLFLDYMYYSGRTVNRRRSNKHFSLAVGSLDKICSFISNPSRKFACINDVQMSDEKYHLFREGILEAFAKHFPRKSEFEL